MKRYLVSVIVCAVFVGTVGVMVMSTGCARHTPPNWYVVTGTGAADESLPPAQRRLMALKAAKEDARRQLLEAAKGIEVDSRTTVRDFVTQSDVIQSRVMGAIAGAQQINEPRYMQDGTVEVDMRLDLNQIRHLVR